MAGFDSSNAIAPTLKRRSFAWKILGIHALLLASVLALVFEAAAQIYRGTRDEEQLQAKNRQELLADQTVRGIENYYQSILEDLKWVQYSAGQASSPATRPVELGKYISAIFYYDKTSGAVTQALNELPGLAAADVSRKMRDWLAAVRSDRVSMFMRLKGAGVSLVATPVAENEDRLLVAVVPGARIESEWLPLLTEPNGASAALLDEHLQVITSSDRQWTDKNLLVSPDAELGGMVQDYMNHPRTMSGILDRHAIGGGEGVGPRLVTLTPVDVAGEDWVLLLAAPLDRIDANVNQLLRTTVLWAGFVAVSVAAILISTGIQLIRYRGRVERVRNQALHRELTQAREIQLNWLPEKSQVDPSIGLAAVNHPASHISGDFYNWFSLSDGRQVVTIGDVSGHGMTAAFLMATTQLLVHNTMMRVCDPGQAMDEVNRQLSSQKFYGQFVTMLIMVIDSKNGWIELASAGHPSPLISEGDGPFRLMGAEAQFVMGLDEKIRYPTQKFALGGTTRILLYTDGVTDALGHTGERYSTELLVSAMTGRYSGAQSIIDAAIAAVNRFRGERDLEDDLTLVAIELHDISAKSSPLVPVQIG